MMSTSSTKSQHNSSCATNAMQKLSRIRSINMFSMRRIYTLSLLITSMLLACLDKKSAMIPIPSVHAAEYNRNNDNIRGVSETNVDADSTGEDADDEYYYYGEHNSAPDASQETEIGFNDEYYENLENDDKTTEENEDVLWQKSDVEHSKNAFHEAYVQEEITRKMMERENKFWTEIEGERENYINSSTKKHEKRFIWHPKDPNVLVDLETGRFYVDNPAQRVVRSSGKHSDNFWRHNYDGFYVDDKVDNDFDHDHYESDKIDDLDDDEEKSNENDKSHNTPKSPSSTSSPSPFILDFPPQVASDLAFARSVKNIGSEAMFRTTGNFKQHFKSVIADFLSSGAEERTLSHESSISSNTNNNMINKIPTPGTSISFIQTSQSSDTQILPTESSLSSQMDLHSNLARAKTHDEFTKQVKYTDDLLKKLQIEHAANADKSNTVLESSKTVLDNAVVFKPEDDSSAQILGKHGKSVKGMHAVGTRVHSESVQQNNGFDEDSMKDVYVDSMNDDGNISEKQNPTLTSPLQDIQNIQTAKQENKKLLLASLVELKARQLKALQQRRKRREKLNAQKFDKRSKAAEMAEMARRHMNNLRITRCQANKG